MLNTLIEWAHHTVNFWWGCAKVSPACEHCYALAMAARWKADLVKWGPLGARWIRRKAAIEARVAAGKGPRKGTPPRIFVNSMSDTFEDHPALDEPRALMLSLIASLPGANWLLLTKRPQNARRMVPFRWLTDWPAHVWIGTTVEDQEHAEERIPHLLDIPAAVRFLSCEPLLGPLDLTSWIGDLLQRPPSFGEIHWCIAGGESGPGARPMHPDWPRSLRDQCAAAGVPFFFKQWGEWAQARHIPPDDFAKGPDRPGYVFVQHDGTPIVTERVGKKKAGRSLDNREWSEVPA